MEIVLHNCNNINSGCITLTEGVLNIKYAINGTGKSTLSKAIEKSILDRIHGSNKLAELTPFNVISDDTINPSVSGCDELNSVKIFDESYINEFTYQSDELLKGSFDILIRDESYDSVMDEIEHSVSQIKNNFTEDEDIEALIKNFDELSSCFGRPTRRGVHGSSTLAKAFKDGNKIKNIPDGLEPYQHFIQMDNNVKWVKWQQDGSQFIEGSSDCPYCVTDVTAIKDQIKRISEVYDSKSIQNLNKLVQIFIRLDTYFSESTKIIIKDFVSNVDGYTDEQIAYLVEVKEQVDRLNGRFKQLKAIGFFSFKNVEKVIDKLQSYSIDPNLYTHLQSEETLSKIDTVNSSIQKLIDKAGILQGQINIQKIHIEKLVQENKTTINSFLKNAGYKYCVDLIEDDSGEYKLKLIHTDLLTNEVTGVREVLSYGERNAFALVLFMFDAIKSGSDLIVLDDPISSFDKNKKYAIIEMLFCKKDSFRGKTVLLLSHDFEPIVDMLYHHSDRFEKPSTSFLQNNNGQLIEINIEKSDIKTFIDINNENISADGSLLGKLVYLRRTYEVLNSKGIAYQLVSNVLHKRPVPLLFQEGVERIMTEDEIEVAELEVQKRIPEFEYSQALQFLTNNESMKQLYIESTNNYEKLHIYRILFNGVVDLEQADVVTKFINQAFHIENDYIYQLNPAKYQTVPQYVIDECDQLVEAL